MSFGTMPTQDELRQYNPETFSWFGRAIAAIGKWNSAQSAFARGYADKILSPVTPRDRQQSYTALVLLIQEARADLRLTTLGPINTAIGQGYVFDYFDEIRKLVELATTDLFFIDPYLDADFVSRYLPHVRDGIQIRLLAREKIPTLIPAVKVFAQQYPQRPIQVRSAANFHDRYFLVDGKSCYQSGASFKDGGRKAPTTITQITDAFGAVQQTYETLWANGHPES
jgi:hypothetical protein